MSEFQPEYTNADYQLIATQENSSLSNVDYIRLIVYPTEYGTSL